MSTNYECIIIIIIIIIINNNNNNNSYAMANALPFLQPQGIYWF